MGEAPNRSHVARFVGLLPVPNANPGQINSNKMTAWINVALLSSLCLLEVIHNRLSAVYQRLVDRGYPEPQTSSAMDEASLVRAYISWLGNP